MKILYTPHYANKIGFHIAEGRLDDGTSKTWFTVKYKNGVYSVTVQPYYLTESGHMEYSPYNGKRLELERVKRFSRKRFDYWCEYVAENYKNYHLL